MDDLERPRRPAAATSTTTTDVTSEQGGAEAPAAQEDADVALLLRMAQQQDPQQAPSASDQAFDSASSAPAPSTPHAAAPAAKRPHGTSSHDGGFTGFGAEFQPYGYMDPHLNHNKLDPEVRKLGVQHTRIFVPWGAVETGLLGKAATDYEKANIDHLTAQLQQTPNDPKLQERLHNAQKQYANDTSFTNSFVKTLELAGKQTTINLTFCGATGRPETIDQFSKVVRYLIGQGYTGIQLTLENEPNGPDQSDSNRGHFNKGVRDHNQAEMDAAAKNYVDEYARLDADLRDQSAGNVRDQVSIVGGDMVPNNRTKFFETITKLGLNKYVDSYSFHLYWGANKGIGGALQDLKTMQALGHKYAKGKSLQITEFGKERFTTAEERAKDPDHKGVHAVEAGTEPAFEQGLFALSAVNDGFTGVVKWDAFYAGEHHKGDGKGDPGQYYMIQGPQQGYSTDATYRLIRMFTHATEPGWRVQGTNHGVEGAEAHFKSADGKGGAILAMSKGGGSVSTAGLPHERLHVTTWNANGKGGLETSTVAHGAAVHIPANGAVAVSTKAMG
jgi:hypothetical protein